MPGNLHLYRNMMLLFVYLHQKKMINCLIISLIYEKKERKKNMNEDNLS